MTDHVIKDLFKTKDENCIQIMCSKVVQRFKSSPINNVDKNLVQITNNISTVQDLILKQNVNESKKFSITSTQITNESTQHVTNTKQANETTFGSGLLKKKSSIDEASSKITSNNNVGNKMHTNYQ